MAESPGDRLGGPLALVDSRAELAAGRSCYMQLCRRRLAATPMQNRVGAIAEKGRLRFQIE